MVDTIIQVIIFFFIVGTPFLLFCLWVYGRADEDINHPENLEHPKDIPNKNSQIRLYDKDECPIKK